jgi:hypothetical protein
VNVVPFNFEHRSHIFVITAQVATWRAGISGRRGGLLGELLLRRRRELEDRQTQ